MWIFHEHHRILQVAEKWYHFRLVVDVEEKGTYFEAASVQSKKPFQKVKTTFFRENQQLKRYQLQHKNLRGAVNICDNLFHCHGMA